MISKELKILVWSFVISILSMVGHNVFYAFAIGFPNSTFIFNIFSVLLFFLTLISAFVFVVVLIYTGIRYLFKGKPKDAWKIGWIGLILLIFFLVVKMDGWGFYAFASILILFFVVRIVEKLK